MAEYVRVRMDTLGSRASGSIMCTCEGTSYQRKVTMIGLCLLSFLQSKA